MRPRSAAFVSPMNFTVFAVTRPTDFSVARRPSGSSCFEIFSAFMHAFAAAA